MKVHLANHIKASRIIVGLATISIATIILSGCTKQSKSNSILYNYDDYSLYPEVLDQVLPSFRIEESENKPYYILNSGGIAEAFDTQTVGGIEAGIAKYWYPQYLATVIIAVDRDQTDERVSHWNDLFSTKEEVGFSDLPGNIQMLTAAMSYGLEGEGYSLTKTIQLLTLLHDNNRLKINSFQSPIIICFDYQAVKLIEDGHNIEIIIPAEGTYTYEKGLLSNERLNFQGNVDELLLRANLRLLDGQSNSFVYPDEISYSSACKVTDYKHFAKNSQKVKCFIERRVLDSKRYMSIDNREHLYVALIYIIIVTIWAASLLGRSIQKGISYSAFFTGIILNGWTMVRLIKYQIGEIPSLSRYLWYSFYIFQLSLPLVLLWMAWAIDKAEDEIIPPKWWRNMLVIIGGLIILVFTNDLHGQVFHLDLSRPDWNINYSYGMGYYIILFISMMNLLAVFIILIQKSIRSPRKKGFIFPIGVFIMFGIYNYKYITRDPFIYETDLTIITGVFTMLMFESCIWSGLIPVNTKYIDLFTGSPLRMQIINNNRQRVMASATAIELHVDTLEKLIDSSPGPILEEDSLLFANPIPGGYAIWHEDVSKLYELHREVQESRQMLIKANAMLAEEEKLRRPINEESAKKELMQQLEGEIAESLKLLSTMIEELPKSENHTIETTRIALLLCHIKRRCNLFFQEKKTKIMDGKELIVYIEELSEIASYSDVKIVTIKEVNEDIPIRYAILFYDFFYSIIDFAVGKKIAYIIQDLESKDQLLKMRFLLSAKLGEFKPEASLISAIKTAKGRIVTKDLEDTIGISISFPKGGDKYD